MHHSPKYSLVVVAPLQKLRPSRLAQVPPFSRVNSGRQRTPGDDAHVCRDGPPELLDRHQIRIRDGPHRLEKLVRGPRYNLPEQVFLGLNMRIKTSRFYGQRVGNIAYACGLIAACGKKPLGHFKYLSASIKAQFRHGGPPSKQALVYCTMLIFSLQRTLAS